MLQAKPRDTRLGDPEENRKTIYRNVCVKNIRRERAEGGGGREARSLRRCARIKLARVSVAAHFSFFRESSSFRGRVTGFLFNDSFYVFYSFFTTFYLFK